MKKQSKSGNPFEIRKQRYFSETFKRAKVKELTEKQITMKEICELYKVSRQSVYTWLYRYSPHYEKGTNQIIEMESEARKSKLLLERVAELEGVIGRKQLTIDYLEKLIDVAGKELGYDLKKTFGPNSSNGSGVTERTTATN
jgi:transposase-like protein